MKMLKYLLAGLLVAGAAWAQDEPEAPPEPPADPPATEAPPPAPVDPPADPPAPVDPPAPAEPPVAPPPAEPMGDDEKHNCGEGQVCCMSSDGWPSEDGKYRCVSPDECKDPNQQPVKDIGPFCKKK